MKAALVAHKVKSLETEKDDVSDAHKGINLSGARFRFFRLHFIKAQLRE